MEGKRRFILKLPRGKIKSMILCRMFYRKEKKGSFFKGFPIGKIETIFLDCMFYQKENKRFNVIFRNKRSQAEGVYYVFLYNSVSTICTLR